MELLKSVYNFLNSETGFDISLRSFLYVGMPFFIILAAVMMLTRPKYFLDYCWTAIITSIAAVIVSTFLIRETEYQFSYLVRTVIWFFLTLSCVFTLPAYLESRYNVSFSRWIRNSLRFIKRIIVRVLCYNPANRKD